MAEEPQRPSGATPGEPGGPNRWKYPIAGLVILIFAGLVVYQTVRTGEIPLAIAGPLLAAALWGLFTFSLSDFTGK